MKVGIDGTPFEGKVTGIGNYLIQVINVLAQNFPMVTFNIYASKPVSLPLRHTNVIVIYEQTPLKYLKSSLWLKLVLWRYVKRDKVDFFIGTNSFLPFLPDPTKSILFVHDLNYIVVPETMKLSVYLMYRLLFRHEILKADYLVCNSYATSKRLKSTFSRKADFTIHPKVNDHFKSVDKVKCSEILVSLGIDYPFLLTVGTFEPRKNLISVIKAFLSLKKRGKLDKYKLLLVGKSGWKNSYLKELISINKKDILSLGYVNDSILPFLYMAASLFIFPSYYEGFGIPVREALTMGTKVITSDIDELREAGSVFAKYINNPRDISALENIIMESLQSKPLREEEIVFPESNDLDKFIDLFK